MCSMTKIENLKWQFGDHINFVTFKKFVTLLSQNLNKLICSQYFDLQLQLL